MNTGYARRAFRLALPRHAEGVGRKRLARRNTGFTLIELIIFIVVAGVLAAGLAAVFSTGMRGVAAPGQLTQATQIAQERMELMLGRRRAVGFATFADPCPGSALCTPVPAGYTVNTNIATGWGGDPNFKVITVTVTGPSSAVFTALVANY
jgi:prepilin-type N-terminal cleavage/methylation domain-containing protein